MERDRTAELETERGERPDGQRRTEMEGNRRGSWELPGGGAPCPAGAPVPLSPAPVPKLPALLKSRSGRAACLLPLVSGGSGFPWVTVTVPGTPGQRRAGRPLGYRAGTKRSLWEYARSAT